MSRGLGDVYKRQDYFIGEYTETTDDEFQEIYDKFFHRWFWDDVYVCYSQEVLEIEKESWIGRVDINEDEAFGHNPYRLFKLVKKTPEGINTYYSVYTGLHYEIDTNTIPMVWASCNKGRNWRDWSFLIKEFIGAEQSFIITQRLASKRIQREVKNQATIVKENTNLECLGTVFDIEVVDVANKNKYEPFRACDPEIPRGIWDNLLNWFMTRAGWLGYVQNMNDKKERLTTGENFKDLHAVTNVQYRNIKRLNAFGRLFGIKYPGKELNFNLSNWGEAQGVPEGEFGGEEIDNIKGNENDKY